MTQSSLSPELRTALEEAGHCLSVKDFAGCEAALARASSVNPNHVEVLHLQGLLLFEQKKTWAAFHQLDKVVRAAPNNAAYQHNLAAIQISLGKFEDAEQHLMRALDIQPRYAEAYHTLAAIRKFTKGDKILSGMEQLAEQGPFSPQDASFLCFALAKAYDDANFPERAWKALVQANAQMNLNYEREQENREVAETLEIYSADFIAERIAKGHPSSAPIFVVGMPRSGTTLLESLLAVHPQVFAAGELGALAGLGLVLAEKSDSKKVRYGHGHALQATSPNNLFAAGQGYLNAVQESNPAQWFDYFVDKLPDNSFNLGLIACVLPRARVLHIMRHPLDVMLSIFFQRFNAVPYAFKPEDIVNHYKNYRTVMAHWRKVLPPGMLLELRYENLIKDKAFAQDFLWDRLGLTSGHPAFSHSNGPQRTASRWQVRQPIYQSSRERFRKYEQHMEAFIEAFGGISAINNAVEQQELHCALRANAQP